MVVPKEEPMEVCHTEEGEASTFASCLWSTNGRMIENVYSHSKSLPEKYKQLLSTLVIHKEFEGTAASGDTAKFKITTERFLQLRQHICDRFSGEKPEDYYMPYKTTR
ncbi:hypothetical protein DMENIID0001_165850 [Sergentomyia squamirostris]